MDGNRCAFRRKGSRQIKKRWNKNEMVCRASPTSKIFLRINNTAQHSFEAVKVMASPALPMFHSLLPIIFLGFVDPELQYISASFHYQAYFRTNKKMIKYTFSQNTATTCQNQDVVWRYLMIGSEDSGFGQHYHDFINVVTAIMLILFIKYVCFNHESCILLQSCLTSIKYHCNFKLS